MQRILIVGHTLPEPSTTAAGVRMMQLIALFKDWGSTIAFASTAKQNEHSAKLAEMDVECFEIELNSPSFDEFVVGWNPSMVVFDRFITEEQFGWRVAEMCPHAMRVLDTEDLHFLRKARQSAVLKNEQLNFYTETAKRELASILRSDVSLIISTAEMELLMETFSIAVDKLIYLPLFAELPDEAVIAQMPRFEERQHFISIGNMLHAPNSDAVMQLKKEIWPAIRKELPKAELHVYGNYASEHIQKMHAPKDGFHIKGWAEDAEAVLHRARVCLAPLRFGAGLKGKVLSAMASGTPCVTTAVGAEGIAEHGEFGGLVEDESAPFAQAAIQLYNQKIAWLSAQGNGFALVGKWFAKDLFKEAFETRISYLQETLETRRQQNFIGAILQQQTSNASKYMSKWIEEKNRGK